MRSVPIIVGIGVLHLGFGCGLSDPTIMHGARARVIAEALDIGAVRPLHHLKGGFWCVGHVSGVPLIWMAEMIALSAIGRIDWAVGICALWTIYTIVVRYPL